MCPRCAHGKVKREARGGQPITGTQHIFYSFWLVGLLAGFAFGWQACRALNNRRRGRAVTVVTYKVGGAVHTPNYGEQLMPLSTLLPFALIVVIGIVVFYTAYRAGV